MSIEIEDQKNIGLEEIAYIEIRKAILKGTYPPGCQIAEEVLASQLNMSRSPVRNAIRRLQADGFLERQSNRRVYVALVNPRRIVDALFIRQTLEGTAAYLAALRRTSEDIEMLQHCLEADATASNSGDPLVAYNQCMDVHRLIYSVSKNTQLERIGINALEQEAAFSYSGLIRDHNRLLQSHNEHKGIVQAVVDANAEEAERLARAHLNNQISKLKAFVAEKMPTDDGLLPLR